MYVNDVNTTFNKAVTAGAKPKMPVTDMFLGVDSARYRIRLDISGALRRTKKDTSPEEINKAGQEFLNHMQKK
ncbi:MAG TPA: hypothetical protein VNK25_04030 [Candidatus Nitrosotenuis sp.]|jgi:hypothetical protein|nr:hypothetical protein [Candidatus Nitrosotenuis sp.]